MKLRIILIIIVAIISGQTWADDKVFSYSMEEMYQMASYFRAIREGKDLEGSEQYIRAAEFKGYISASLDYSNDFNLCAKSHSVNDIAMRTALVITSNPLDRSNISAINVIVSLHFACDESNW